MDGFINKQATLLMNDLMVKSEVLNTVNTLINVIEAWDNNNNIIQLQYNLELTNNFNNKLIKKIKSLQMKNKKLTNRLDDMKSKAALTRSDLLTNIRPFLVDNIHTNKMKDKIIQLEEELSLLSSQYADLLSQQPLITSTIDNASNIQSNNDKDNLDKVVTNDRISSLNSDNNNNKNKSNNCKDSHGNKNSRSVMDQVSDDTSPPTVPEVQIVPTTTATVKEQQLFLYDIKDEALLEIFSFLQTNEVLYSAQVCRYMYKRVDGLFGIDSQIITPQWGNRPKPIPRPLPMSPNGNISVATESSATNNNQTSNIASSFSFFNIGNNTVRNSTGNNTAVDSAVSATVLAAAKHSIANQDTSNNNAITKEIIDEMLGKLSVQESKIIMAIAEANKKQASQIESLGADKDDLNERMMNGESVRNFLIEKLKSAEKEIKNLMGQNSTLKKQSTSDQEIIAYLDLKGYEMESEKYELSNRCTQLQASLDLQIGTHSHKEQHLTRELEDYKLKYEKLDANFKSQKKLLVKEVKSLRSQVEQLTTERNIQGNQFRMLKEALNIPITNNSINKNSGSKYSNTGR